MHKDWKLTASGWVSPLFFETKEEARQMQAMTGGVIYFYQPGIGYIPETKVGFDQEPKSIPDFCVTKMTVRLGQEGNTMGTTSDYEDLEVIAEYQIPEEGRGEECFLTIRSESGWSIDTPEALNKILDAIVESAGKISRATSESVEIP